LVRNAISPTLLRFEMKKIESVSKPMFVFRDGMLANSSYVEWLSDVKKRFRQSQVKASIRVNTEMLEFYWGIGHWPNCK